MTDTAALREAAEKATPGEWTYGAQWVCRKVSNDEYEYLAQSPLNQYDSPQWNRNARFITLANPATILALCDELDRLRTEAEPVAWEGCEPNTGHSDITRRKHKADSWRTKGWFVRPLYARTEADVRVTDEADELLDDDDLDRIVSSIETASPAPTVGDDLVERLDKRLQNASQGDRQYERPMSWDDAAALLAALTTLRERVARLEGVLQASADEFDGTVSGGERARDIARTAIGE